MEQYAISSHELSLLYLAIN